nr:cytoplasmic tyrosine-protein kinase BMX-like [Crassostrea gigas]
MEDPKFFVRVHGLVLSTPPMLVMEKAQYGSLASFFRRRQTSQPIKPFHLLNAASQVAQGMLFLNEHQLVHGNLCCRNLLVFRYEIDDILVKIGDPGMVSLMNSLDLSLPQNRSRSVLTGCYYIIKILQTPAHTRLDPPRSLDEATEWKRKVLDLMSLCWKPVRTAPLLTCCLET